MARRVVVHRGFSADLTEAIDWYEALDTPSGQRFAKSVERALSSLKRGNHGTPKPGARRGERWLAVPGFKVWVVFVERPGLVFIAGLRHSSRRPKSRDSRLPR